jgi:hypothetical protein
MTRIIKTDKYIYINAPSNGPYHAYPTDNYRFLIDTSKSLVYWSNVNYGSIPSYPVIIEESFFIHPKNDIWKDFVCVFKRTNESIDYKYKKGILETKLNNEKYKTGLK